MAEISKREVIRYLGYGDNLPDEKTSRLIDEMIDSALKNITPKSVHGIFDLKENDDGTLTVSGTSLLLEGHDITAHLKGAHKCIIYACTLGAQAERMINLYQKTDMEKAVIFDAVCDAYVENYSDRRTEALRSELKKSGLYINNRFSPGYGDFAIDKQRELLSALNCSKAIGLTVTDSFVLLPRKSISALIGVFAFPPSGVARGCECCNLKDTCKMRGSNRCSRQTDSI